MGSLSRIALTFMSRTYHFVQRRPITNSTPRQTSTFQGKTPKTAWGS